MARVVPVQDAQQVPAMFHGAEGLAAQVTMLAVRQQQRACRLGSLPASCVALPKHRASGATWSMR